MSTTMIGRLINDPVISETIAGNSKVSFIIEMDRTNGHKVLTTHIECRTMGGNAKNIVFSLNKGDRVIVYGIVTQDGEWNADPAVGKLVLNLIAVGPDIMSQRGSWQRIEYPPTSR